MKKSVRYLAAIAACSLVEVASANSITQTVSISDTDPGSVLFLSFQVSNAGTFSIGAQGADTLGIGYNADPKIYLFETAPSESGFLVSDDDGGVGADALIASIALNVGQYVLAVSETGLQLDEAISGLNAASVYSPGWVFISIESADGVASFTGAPVPLPAPSALLAGGIALLSSWRMWGARRCTSGISSATGLHFSQHT